MKTKGWQSRTRDELIIEVWEKLDCESVGAQELEAIQRVIRETLGAGAVVSPATIARIVADEGAELRHPEVLNCDSKWRAAHLSAAGSENDLSFLDLEAATASMHTLVKRWRAVEKNGDTAQLAQLREVVLHAKVEAQRVARSKIMDEKKRAEAREIVQWLTIWLGQPALFADWLALRRKSPAFRKLTEQ